jgi:asparagine synthetase B (glutamine-hydrolysing)
MSGFVVSFGRPDRRALDVMVPKIIHRGPYRSGICEQHQAMMAQNYLKADFSSGQEHVHQIPVTSPRHEVVRIVYDGQIGNVHELA